MANRSSWHATDPDTGETVCVGITSGFDKYFVPHQPSEVTTLLAETAERLQAQDEYEFSVDGFVATSTDFSRYTNLMNFDGVQINPGDGDDPITLQLRTTVGNDGHLGTHYELGSFRHTCGNRMSSVYDDAGYSQTHQRSLDETLPQFAMESILDGVDAVEARLEEAQSRRFDTRWDALEAIYDTGVPELADIDYADLIRVFDEEVEDPDNASLYEAGQAAYNVLSNEVPSGMPEHVLNPAYDRVSERFFETGAGVPDPEETAEEVVTDRYTELVDGDADEYFEDEQQILEERLDELDVYA